ncbi:MAG TPA: type II toxin-antitoxin system death-on-curing family toxin [Thermoanaerobaculia bacterium]|nr:type II toxin-antitoxin system death-on-curing family toxin [Thermoanaerobaculia bacterium]
MMRYLSLAEVTELHRLVIETSGGSHGIRDLGALESALAQRRMSFGGEDLYPTVVEKAAALGFSLVQNHPFLDGNKRVGHAAVETFLVLNGFEIAAATDEQEQLMLALAAGDLDRSSFLDWLRDHVRRREV